MNRLFAAVLAGHRGHPIAPLIRDLEVVVEAVEQHGDGRSDHLEVAELLGGDVHEQVVHLGILFPQNECLREVLQSSGEFAIGTTELLHEKTGEARVWLCYPYLELKIFVVREHDASRLKVGCLWFLRSAGLWADVPPAYPRRGHANKQIPHCWVKFKIGQRVSRSVSGSAAISGGGVAQYLLQALQGSARFQAQLRARVGGRPTRRSRRWR
jgi:hypothetical protein